MKLVTAAAPPSDTDQVSSLRLPAAARRGARKAGGFRALVAASETSRRRRVLGRSRRGGTVQTEALHLQPLLDSRG
jgi:hypothetical protein